MRPILMQDWITVRGTASGNPVAQDPADWLLTAPFQDMTFILDIRELTALGTAGNFIIETAPIRDETLFQNGVVKNLSGAVGQIAVGLTNITSILAAQPNPPIAHWTRWRILAPAAAWDITFRIWASSNVVF